MYDLLLPPDNKGLKIAVLKILPNSQEHTPVGYYLEILRRRRFKKIAKNNVNMSLVSLK